MQEGLGFSLATWPSSPVCALPKALLPASPQHGDFTEASPAISVKGVDSRKQRRQQRISTELTSEIKGEQPRAIPWGGNRPVPDPDSLSSRRPFLSWEPPNIHCTADNSGLSLGKWVQMNFGCPPPLASNRSSEVCTHLPHKDKFHIIATSTT